MNRLSYAVILHFQLTVTSHCDHYEYPRAHGEIKLLAGFFVQCLHYFSAKGMSDKNVFVLIYTSVTGIF